MGAIPFLLQTVFLEEIRTRGGSPARQRDWLKWRCCHLDFCRESGHGPRGRESLQPFLPKLAAKGQGKKRRGPLDYPRGENGRRKEWPAAPPPGRLTGRELSRRS